jgi:hypothetical protein
MASIIYSVLVPPLVWLFFGAPNLQHSGNIGILIMPLLHLHVVIWQRQVFHLLRGDSFTYGMVTRALNFLWLGISLVVARFTLWAFGGDVEDISRIPSYLWGACGFSLLATLTLPVLTSRDVESLPKESERRSFEDPCDTK